MDKLKKIIPAFVFCMMCAFSFAQNNIGNKAEDPTDFMRSNGKIYVVVAVVVTIVMGIFIYLINLERKIKRLEKNQDK